MVRADEDPFVGVDYPSGAVEDELLLGKGIIKGHIKISLDFSIAFPPLCCCIPDGVSTQISIVEEGLVALAYLQDLHPAISSRIGWFISIQLLVVGSVERMIKDGLLNAVTRVIYSAGIKACFGRLPCGGKA